VRAGSAFEEKNGANATIPLMRTSTSVMAERNVGQSDIYELLALSSWLLAVSCLVPVSIGAGSSFDLHSA